MRALDLQPVLPRLEEDKVFQATPVSTLDPDRIDIDKMRIFRNPKGNATADLHEDSEVLTLLKKASSKSCFL